MVVAIKFSIILHTLIKFSFSIEKEPLIPSFPIIKVPLISYLISLLERTIFTVSGFGM